MAKIEGFCVKNFRTLKDVTLGRLWNKQTSEPLTPMTAVIVFQFSEAVHLKGYLLFNLSIQLD